MAFKNLHYEKLQPQKTNANLLNSHLENGVPKNRPSETPAGDKRQSDIADEPIATYFRSKALMSIYPAKDRVLLKFMEALDDGTYDKNSRSFFMIDRDELFKVVVQLEGDLKDPIDLFHTHGSEQKTLKIGRGRKDPNVFFVYFVNTNGTEKRVYTISFDAVEFRHFKTILRLLLYEMFTGTRAGFNYNWI